MTEIECAGYVVDNAQRIIHLWANDTAEFVFTNTKKPGFRLIKTSADGSPLDGVTFRIAPIGDASHSIDRTTQNGGEISVDGLEPGIYSVQETATLPNHILDKTEYHVELSPGKVSELRLSNDKKPGFRLIKTSADGTPLDGVTFRIARIEDGSRYLDRTTKNGGEIFVEDLEPGMWSVTEIATLPDHILDQTEHHVELFPNKTSELRLKNDKKPLLTLSKIDADSQRPIPNTVLTVKALDGTYQDDWKTGPDGTVSLRVDPGVYQVTEKSVPSPYYIPDKDADRTQTITLGANDEKTLVFRNRKAPEITIFKENSITGEPIEHAKFHITYTSNGEAAEAPATIDYGEVFTDSRGEIKVHELGKRLYPGEYEITELEPADGFQLKEPLTQTVIIHGNESKTVRFQNTPLSALVVWKYDSVTREPVEGAIFQVKYMSGTSGSGGTVIGTYKTGPGGSFIQIRDMHPVKDDAFSMTICGRTYTERKAAGEAILAACKSMTGPDQPLDLGTFRGFPMQLHLKGECFVVTMKQNLTYRAELSDEPLGNITRINNALERINESLEGQKRSLVTLEGNLKNAKEEAARPFPQEEELSAKAARLSELNAELDNDGKSGNEKEQGDGEKPAQVSPNAPAQEGDKPSIRAALKGYIPPAPVSHGPEKSQQREAEL